MYILFDIGASKMRVALSRDKKSFDKNSVKIVPTPDNFAEGIGMFQKLALELTGHRQIKAAAGGIAGSLDQKKGILHNAPNMPDWNNKPIRKTFEKILGTKKIFLENDTAMVGLGEAKQGAGKKNKIVAYITVSTGINGVRIVDGIIDRNAHGFEIGHQIIGGAPEKTLENYVGAAALSKKYHTPLSEINNPMLWDIIHMNLSYGVHNTILYWSPDVMVLGGGQVHAGKISVQKVSAFISKFHNVFADMPPIKKAILGDIGGICGALEYLKQQK